MSRARLLAEMDGEELMYWRALYKAEAAERELNSGGGGGDEKIKLRNGRPDM